MIEGGREWGGPRWHRRGWEGTDVDLAAVKEAVGEAPAWTRWQWRWHSVEVGAKEEQAHDVDSVAIGKAVGETLTSTRRRCSRGGGQGAGSRVVAK
jgi:hypothetical protein